jgi:hypothetical protein
VERNVVLVAPDESPSLACNVLAAIFSFFVLATLEYFSSLYMLGFSATMESAWMLWMELLPHGPVVNATLGMVVLTVVAVGLQLFRRYRRFPDWLPLVLAWPSALALVGPSALEHADDWASWLVLGALAALVFCSHWFCLLLAEEAWD